MKRLVTLVLSIVAAATACTQPNSEITVKTLEYGIFTAEVERPRTGVNETMRAALIRNLCHTMTTAVVPARDGIRFGFRYVVQGPPPGTPVEIRKVVKFPDHQTAPTSAVSYVVNEERERVHVDSIAYFGWVSGGTRPGTWTFQIFDKDRKLAEMVFTVVDKDAFAIRPDGQPKCFQMINPRE
jgi:hypothetical protein